MHLTSTQITTLIVCTGIFLLAFIGVQILLHYCRQLDRRAIEGIQWQLEKMGRFANGWRPELWNWNDPTVTEKEKVAALKAYLDGKPIPASGLEARRLRCDR